MFETPRTRLGSAFGISLGAHAAGLLLVLLVIGSAAPPETASTPRTPPPAGIIWLAQPGPGGGGGGGGNDRPGPPRAAEMPGRDRLTMPAAAARAEAPSEAPEPALIPLTIPAVPTAASIAELPGVLAAAPSATLSRGAGNGTGAGGGRGSGIDGGEGSGLGHGYGGGTGGDAFEPGSGVTTPRLVYDPKPDYPPDAVHARIEGAVWLEAVVMPDGSVGPVRVTRSLDSRFGLDQEAMRTVRRWRFVPGMRGGKPVPVRVSVELAFTLR